MSGRCPSSSSDGGRRRRRRALWTGRSNVLFLVFPPYVLHELGEFWVVLRKLRAPRLYDPIISQLRRAVENNGRGANAALAEARRTKLTKHHPELSGLVEDVRRIH